MLVCAIGVRFFYLLRVSEWQPQRQRLSLVFLLVLEMGRVNCIVFLLLVKSVV